MKKTIIISALGVLFMASCADTFDHSYEMGRPDNVAEYGYLSDYQPLKSYVDRSKYAGFKLGVGTTVSDYLKKELVYGLTNSNFDETVAGNAMKMASCVKDDGSMDFSSVMEYVQTATDAGLSVYGHTLAWHAQQPVKWLQSLLADRPVEIDPDAMVETVVHECDYANHSSYPWYRMSDLPQVEGGILTIANPEAKANWEVQYFVDDGIPTTVGGDYILRVTIKGSADGSLNCNVGDWSGQASCLVTFSEEWATLDFKVNAVPASSSFVVFQSGAFVGTIWVKKVELIKKESAGPATYMEELVVNGDMEGTDVSCFYTTEPATGGPHASQISDGIGVDGSRGIMVQSADNPVNDWDCQFFIRLPEALPADTKYRIEFDYRADKEGDADTQAHGEPGSYYHWQMVGSPHFTSEWQHWEKTGSISADQAGTTGMRTIAFNLSKNKTATKFYFDNIRFEVERQSTTGGIPLTADERRDTLTWAMEQWIMGMMSACDGKVKAWDVVNEAISGGSPDAEGVYALQHASGNESDFFWQDDMGDLEYVRAAVRLARKYGPEDIKLFVNDYNLESDWDQNGKLKSLIKWIERWEADGITKIDGIGTQMHISCYMNPATQESKKNAIVNMFKLMAQTGKLIRISELDMGLVDADGNDVITSAVTEEQHKAMAELYKFVVGKYLELIPAAQQWGICQWAATDSPANSGWRANSPIGLWDLNYHRKHTYAGFADGLSGK